MKAIDPNDKDPDPNPEPGIDPESDIGPHVPSVTLEVDGELFATQQDQHGGTDYTWLNGPNPGYGFSLSPTRDLSLDQHRDNIRDFIADIDPSTGFLRED